jgi:hypothetical protein
MDVLVSTGAGDRIIQLEPGQQNNGTVTPRAVRPRSNFDRLMGGNHWLEIFTDIAVIYHSEYAEENRFNSRTSLHCVPFVPVGTGPFTTGYQLLSPEPNALDHSDPQPVEDAPAADSKDGEFDMGAQSGNLLLPFGEYVRTKVKVGGTTYISVRLNLRRLDTSKAQLQSIKPTWKHEIESIWNSAPISSTGQKYLFEVDWTDRESHSSVFVRDTFEFFWEDGQRDSMFLWSLGMGTGNFPTKVAAHEYGHHLGLGDGYHYQGEFPELAEEMTKTSSLFRGRTIVPTFETRLWSMFAAPVTSLRAAERIRNGAFASATPANLMMGTARYGTSGSHKTRFKSEPDRSHVSAVTLVDQELIDAIENQSLQKLYLDEGDFLARKSYHDSTFSYDGYYNA